MNRVETLESELAESLAENERLRAIIDEAQNQEPFVWLWVHSNGSCANGVFNSESEAISLWGGLSIGGKAMAVYAAPVPVQSTAVAVPDEETNFCTLKSITDSQVNAVARAFWRRIYAYRNDYGIELPKPLPVEFMAHMVTALSWVDREPLPRVTEQDAQEIVSEFIESKERTSVPISEWLTELLEKLNEKTTSGEIVIKCSECESFSDVKPIQWRKGWGKSHSWWLTKQFLCADCRSQFHNWRYFR